MGPAPRTVLAAAPLLLVGIAAGVLHATARRAADPRRRRVLDVAWILTLLLGAPLWLFLAATLGLL